MWSGGEMREETAASDCARAYKLNGHTHSAPFQAAAGAHFGHRQETLAGEGVGNSLVNELPHPWRRQRQRARLNSERAERGGNRIGDDAADRNDAALAHALGAERIIGRGLFLE